MNIPKNSFGNKNGRKKFKSKKVYLTLSACAVVLSVAGWSTYLSVKDYFKPPPATNIKPQISKKQMPISEPKHLEPEKDNDFKSSETISHSKNNFESLSESDAEEVQVASVNIKDLEIVYPSSDEIAKDFSDGKPMYSKTLGDWRVHDGVDFKADPGSDIKSVALGKVKNIYQDANYGTTVVVEHDANFTAYYCGLQENVFVKKDQQLKAGDNIGKLNSSPCECCDDSHFHFMIFKDEKFIDPMLVLDKELQ